MFLSALRGIHAQVTSRGQGRGGGGEGWLGGAWGEVGGDDVLLKSTSILFGIFTVRDVVVNTNDDDDDDGLCTKYLVGGWSG